MPKKNSLKTTADQVSESTKISSSSAFSSSADLSLKDLFYSTLKDTYWAENHLIKAIPKMIAAAGSSELKDTLQAHLTQTQNHAARLESVFETLGEKILAKKCDAMEGLTISGEHVIENTVAGSGVRDLGLILAGLKVENFEQTTYQGLIQMANTLRNSEVTEFLQQNLDEEVEAADILKGLSQNIPAE